MSKPSDSQNDSRELRNEINYRLVMASEVTIDEPDLKRMITSVEIYITQRDLEQKERWQLEANTPKEKK